MMINAGCRTVLRNARYVYVIMKHYKTKDRVGKSQTLCVVLFLCCSFFSLLQSSIGFPLWARVVIGEEGFCLNKS